MKLDILDCMHELENHPVCTKYGAEVRFRISKGFLELNLYAMKIPDATEARWNRRFSHGEMKMSRLPMIQQFIGFLDEVYEKIKELNKYA